MQVNGFAVRGVLFDKDGTLLDFQQTWAPFALRLMDELSAGDGALRDALAESAGFDLATSRYLAQSPLAGGDGSELMARWLALLPEHDAKSLKMLIFARIAEVIQAGQSDDLTPASRDLAGLLARLKAAGGALGVATHDSEMSARAQIQALGVGAAFAFFAGSDSGFPRKPDPAVLRAFSDAVGCAPAEVVVVGDSVIDLELARHGGAAAAIGVLTGPTPADALAPYADFLLDSIDDLPEILAV